MTECFFLREKRKCLFCAKLFDQCVPEPLIFGRKHREIEIVPFIAQFSVFFSCMEIFGILVV